MFFVLRHFRDRRHEALDADTTEDVLIEHAQGGELEAFNLLIDRHRQAVYRVALRYMRDPDLAADVTQDAFLRAYRSIDSFRNDRGGGFRPWLLRITANRALDVLRARARRPASSLDAMLEQRESNWEPTLDEDGPTELAERRALRDQIEHVIGQLSEDQRMAVVLYDIEGYSYEEMAEITDVAIGTVKSRLHRGRARLRELLLSDPTARELYSDLLRLSNDAESGGSAPDGSGQQETQERRLNADE